MKKLILILLLSFPFLSFGQNNFTDEEMIKIDSLFQVHEQTDSLQKLDHPF